MLSSLRLRTTRRGKALLKFPAEYLATQLTFRQHSKMDGSMPTSRVFVPTDNSSRYLQQLCKHWSHKFETAFTPTHGRIALPIGETVLVAEDAGLAIELTAPDGNDLAQFRDVVQRHVERFAFRETLTFDWQSEDHATQVG